MRRATSFIIANVKGSRFLSTLSLRRATLDIKKTCKALLISIHALLAESDFIGPLIFSVQPHFYPRSPCGERRSHDFGSRVCKGFLSTLSLRRATSANIFFKLEIIFLSTLSLRRATFRHKKNLQGFINFYPRSPCGERLCILHHLQRQLFISIHALLAESDRLSIAFKSIICFISIHALLAESDMAFCMDCQKSTYFYPRSPCGERRQHPHLPRLLSRISIHALLAESDLSRAFYSLDIKNFYPRSPCGERLRHKKNLQGFINFYPRSPCGERHSERPETHQRDAISIHALLAESDLDTLADKPPFEHFYPRSPCGERRGSGVGNWPRVIFLSTLSLRRATLWIPLDDGSLYISIHALLAESDNHTGTGPTEKDNFYPRSPCGERQANAVDQILPGHISIHALLAESDRD